MSTGIIVCYSVVKITIFVKKMCLCTKYLWMRSLTLNLYIIREVIVLKLEIGKMMDLSNTGIIFDMDGVIIDTCSLHESAWFAVSKLFGFSWNKACNFKRDVFGTSSTDSAIILFGKDVLNYNMHEVCRRKDEFYQEILHEDIYNIVIPGFIPFFERLLYLEIPVALATSSVNYEAEFVLKSLGIYKHFKAVIDASKVKNPKPHPEVYLRACDALGKPAANCIGFEDSLTGIQALQQAGVKCVVVGSTLTMEKLNSSGVKYETYIEDFSMIPLNNIVNEDSNVLLER